MWSNLNLQIPFLMCFIINILFLIVTIYYSVTCKIPKQTIVGESFIEISRKVSEITNCTTMRMWPEVKKRGEFWVLYNYVQAEIRYNCSESVTYTTQGDFTFLDNLEVLVEQWNGPVSLAIYAPGDDFLQTVNSIHYLRNCGSTLIRNFVTFHLFFSSSHIPHQKKKLMTPFSESGNFINCSIQPPYKTVDKKKTYKQMKNLTYPINVARNIARERAETYFVFASDIELYPTKNLPQKFLKMISKKTRLHQKEPPSIYVLPVFEVLQNENIPKNKTELKNMYDKHTAFLFHKNLCSMCHSIPELNSWMINAETNDLDIFTVAKRQGKHRYWEAFYIGTNRDPFFDERLTWEGQSNKMTQAYVMCLLDYDYMVLNNAFLIHKPGLKKSKEQLTKHMDLVRSTNKLLKSVIKEELDSIFGRKKACTL